ncbi:MAG: hypothetical protein JXM79_22830, partial [Sedimentisphaerales bacterium]|nr:hypothetical protein [Sedimentisphaerales bacterium]
HNDSKELKEQPGNYLEKISRSYNLVIQRNNQHNETGLRDQLDFFYFDIRYSVLDIRYLRNGGGDGSRHFSKTAKRKA